MDGVVSYPHVEAVRVPAATDVGSASWSAVVQVTFYAADCFWVHIYEEHRGAPMPALSPLSAPEDPAATATAKASAALRPTFGSLAVTLCAPASEARPPTVCSSVLLDPVGRSVLGGEGSSAGEGASPQTVFAQQLADRIGRRHTKKNPSAAAVYVSCGIEGEHAAEALGVAGTSLLSNATVAFGGTVFRACCSLLSL